jgi:2-hydroxy-3-oxopropionate reductase
MVGGEDEDFERARPVFEVMGETVVHVGETGAGQVVKACNQIVVALVIEAVAEALVDCRSLLLRGQDPRE